MKIIVRLALQVANIVTQITFDASLKKGSEGHEQNY
jgi:hypothetical protein